MDSGKNRWSAILRYGLALSVGAVKIACIEEIYRQDQMNTFRCLVSGKQRGKVLTSSKERPKSTKAMLAIAFAGSMLTSQLPCVCKESSETTSTTTSTSTSSSVIESITKSVKARPEEKAYYLLQIASCYITGGDVNSLETHLKAQLGQRNNNSLFHSLSRGEPPLVSWANSVSLLSHSASGTNPSVTGNRKISNEKRAVADKAIGAAIAQLGQGFDDAQALNLYLIASCLSRMTGNTQNEQKCIKALNEAIRACEASKTVDSVRIKVASSILNSMAYGLIPISIPDYQAPTPAQATVIDRKNIDQSERLKLRAAALLDRLPTADHDRRKAHRDLSLWYLQFGKGEKARKEKQELFKLVGVKDDRILYAQHGSCGHPLWWSLEKVAGYAKCGMG